MDPDLDHLGPDLDPHYDPPRPYIEATLDSIVRLLGPGCISCCAVARV